MEMETVQLFSFNKDENDDWFIDIPDYPGNKEDLQMVAGADSMLDAYAEGADSVNLCVNTDGIHGADTLTFIERAVFEDHEIGAFYMFNKDSQLVIWLCDVVEFVFGGFPPVIYIQKCQNT